VTIYVYPADKYGCGAYRLAWPAQALIDQGHDVKVCMPGDRGGIGGSVDQRTGRLVDIQVPDDAEVIVMQRVAMQHLADGIPLLRKRGVAVVVDMDDDLTRIDTANPAYWGFREDTGSPLHNWRNAHRACLQATLVTTSTPKLLGVYAPHGRGVVLENRVPARYLDLPRDLEVAARGAIGWAGAVHSHPKDLGALGPAVQRLVNQDSVPYWGVGAAYAFRPGDDGLWHELGLYGRTGVYATSGDCTLEEYPAAVARIGVGMIPLADTSFNASKSWLKGLEMSACGVPWVASPRAEYRRLAELLGVGALAAKPAHWYRELKRLVDDSALREEWSQRGRAAVVEHALTIEASAGRWLEAWTEAAKIQQGRSSRLIRH
jgi:hypothetical protein